ncbi:RHS repeat-associated protein [Hoylesella shahii DSM 15611 = JCM 12083]|uniref:RHS repeat-associated protein n=1 Tax=Hoylesella shahii DSM 15611 = JCM 12083 TaxID=1122991 RepID=A0A318HPV1_9BACT|nr:RHS repeat-associated protein [Hoylesella shahii DSM 15611 = JCM 12083]
MVGNRVKLQWRKNLTIFILYNLEYRNTSIQRPKRNAVPDTPPGPSVQWDKAEAPDDVQPGYGYVPADTTHHEDIFYYHSDHLGSTSYTTDAKANVAQFDAYLPYGELLVDEHSSTEEMPYKFNGKEFDQETGLYYYGARYMNPRTSLWYGVDPLAEKYPEIGGYIYCHNKPITTLDLNGMEDGTPKYKNKKADLSQITNVDNVLKGKEWIDYQDVHICGQAARKQNNQIKNANPVYDGEQINMYYKNTQPPASTTPIDKAKAIETIIINLKEGKPVMVGVNYKVVGTTGNNNASTDHYVNIVGMGVDEHKRYYFSYYDNYADPYIYRTKNQREQFCTELKANRFYISKKNQLLFDTNPPIVGPNHRQYQNIQYIVTEVKPNRKK